MTTLRGHGATALATALILLSFFLLGTLCSADARSVIPAKHTHVVEASTSEPPGEHCHHDRGHHHGKAYPDRIAPRATDTRLMSPSSDQSFPTGIVIASTVLGGHTHSRPDSGRPSRSGRALLVVLSVARN